MKLRCLIYRIILIGVVLLGPMLMVSCDRFREDLPECRLTVRFKYDYNMKSVDAFYIKVEKVDLYVFDKDGVFLFMQSGEGAELATGNYLMEVNLPVGEYKFMAWAYSGDDSSYDVMALTPGVSTIDEMTVKLKRDASSVIAREIDALWYGEILDVKFTGTKHQTETVNLIKDTNKVRFVFQGNNGAAITLEDYTYEIVYDNGWLGYNNSLLNDDILSYQPYHMLQRSESAILVELNTMRLMERGSAHFVVTKKSTGSSVLDINLVDYLILTKMEEHDWDEQQYLDRQDEYSIIFIFSETEQPRPGVEAEWVAVQITINGYTCYIQTEEQ